MRKLGLVAGGGALPISLAEHCRRMGRPYFVLRLKGFADAPLAEHESAAVGIAEVGRLIRLARDAGCEALCFAGQVRRPDLTALKPDLRGLRALPGALAAARGGDDALLRFLLAEFEQEGFAIEGAHEVMADLALGRGPLGRRAPGRAHESDIAQAVAVAKAIGAFDIGQAVVVCDGVVLAVEAQEGTDALLRRVAELPQSLRGSPARRRGVLAKIPKPFQEQRIDLPVIGAVTLDGVARAGLAGVVGVAGRLLVLDRDAVVRKADTARIFVAGIADG
jgi:DUF1009 family protein